MGMWQSRVVVTALVFLFGLVIGSFLNVCIVRIPEEQSIVRPGSRCPRCRKSIRYYDNVPVVSWLLLRGRCRDCGARISLWYPAIELLTAFFFVWCYRTFGVSPIGLKWLFLGCLLIVLTVTDLRARLLPDAVTWTGFGIGLALSAAVPPQDGIAWRLIWRVLHRLPHPAVAGLLDALIGALFGSFMLWLAGWLYRKWRGREGMGLGDVKMVAMVGAFLGPRDTFLTILAGTVLGTAIGLGILILLYAGGWKRRVAERASRRGLGSVNAIRCVLASQYQLPFGSFLGIAALLVVFLRPFATAWWLPWAGGR